ncbi:MAG: B12-binding domain-containing radical SAM protein [Desulfobacca sp.]|uniref:B12-binding domain-containing radical SAM protein n=1 Tax=Desulfobacca sp. TaxID=2067990 RepID=UPI00404ABF27
MLHALLLQPPPGDLTGPYPALPYLKAYAQRRGFTVQVRDLGLEALYFLTQPARLQELLDRAQERRRQLATRRFLAGPERQLLRILDALAASRTHLLETPAAMACFRDPVRFADYSQYKAAVTTLNAFFTLLSAVHFPTWVAPHDYPPARQFQSLAEILAQGDRQTNPYRDYYETVLLPQIERAAPALVGISLVFASQAVPALILGGLLKERLPSLHVTMGGAYLSQWLLLLAEPQLAPFRRCADSFIMGEGEEACAQLVEQLLAGKPLTGLPNLLYHDPRSGRWHRPPELEYTDVTTLPPPDFSDLDLSAYLVPKPVIPYAISRGCYWGRCVFCQNRYGDNRMRHYQTVPVEKALAEITELLTRHQTDHLNFSNDVVDPAYLRRFSEAVLKSGRSFHWHTDLRAEKAFDAKLCRQLARAGLTSVAIGLESACPRILKAMDKGTQIQVVRQVLRNLYQAGVATQVMGIFGFPGETEAEALETVKFLENNVDRISYYVLGLLLVLPGSRMYRQPEEFGITSLSYEQNPLLTPEPVWRAAQRLSPEAVRRLYARLSRLEEIYELHEYPFVGALSTNHSFLYFERGPDILKRLKREAKGRPPAAAGRQMTGS